MAAYFRDTQDTQNGRAIAFSTQPPAGVKERWGKIQPWEAARYFETGPEGPELED